MSFPLRFFIKLMRHDRDCLSLSGRRERLKQSTPDASRPSSLTEICSRSKISSTTVASQSPLGKLTRTGLKRFSTRTARSSSSTCKTTCFACAKPSSSKKGKSGTARGLCSTPWSAWPCASISNTLKLDLASKPRLDRWVSTCSIRTRISYLAPHLRVISIRHLNGSSVARITICIHIPFPQGSTLLIGMDIRFSLSHIFEGALHFYTR